MSECVCVYYVTYLPVISWRSNGRLCTVASEGSAERVEISR